MNPVLYRDVAALAPIIPGFKKGISAPPPEALAGLCGFDGFVDTFVRLQSPASMAGFGAKVVAAAGVAASYPSRHLGDKFGGNGPLFAAALNDHYAGKTGITYIGTLGHPEILPIFRAALGSKTRRLYSVGRAAQTTCLEFTDGKVMLNDMSACTEVTWERLLQCVGANVLDETLKSARFISAVNWGKLPQAGEIWSNLAARLGQLGIPPKTVLYFMDLAEFEIRPLPDREDLLRRLGPITRQCETILSLNLKEAWQMAEIFGGAFQGSKDADTVAELTAFLRSHIAVDRVIVHPNDGAACASVRGTVYVPGPYCPEPLISTGAGDNFGAACVAATLQGLDDTGIVLAGNCASGYFVRSGRSATFANMAELLDAWVAGTLPERL